MKYWLMKSEPEAFSVDDLEASPGRATHWDGVRNYQARNMMRDEMKIGDQVFFYHSNCAQPGIVGIVEICRESYPDFTAFDPEDKHFDPKSKEQSPTWFMVDIRFIRKLERVLTLHELKQYSQLGELPLLRRGNRLSVIPVTPAQWEFILALE